MLKWRTADTLFVVEREMLKGFTAPRSTLGVAALVPSPPWHFAGDVLAVEFWNDPDVSVHILPTGVELDKECPGHSVALFTDYQFTAQNDEYLDPARYQSRSFCVPPAITVMPTNVFDGTLKEVAVEMVRPPYQKAQ